MAKREDDTANRDWATDWITRVADGTLTMSQRKLSSVEQHGGGTEHVAAVARAAGVHLAVVVDDQENELVVASRHPIRVIC